MQNPIQNFRQSCIVFEKPGITNVYKSVSGSFLFFLDLELFAKLKRPMVSTHSLFTFSLITQDLNKIKKNPTHSFVYICK